MGTPTVLLTGATGYIGSHTWLALAEAGFRVVGVDNFSNSSPAVLDRLELLLGRPPVFERATVCDASAMVSLLARHKIDATVHFAASKAVGESTAKPLTYYAQQPRRIDQRLRRDAATWRQAHRLQQQCHGLRHTRAAADQ